MKLGRRWAVVVAVVAGAATVLPACGGDDSAAQARAMRREMAGEKLAIKGVPGDGRLVGNTVELELSGAGLKIVKPNEDTSGKTGHYVVFVNRPPVAFGAKIPEGRGVMESEEEKVVLTGFTEGTHKVSVVLADGANRRLGTKAAEASFTVSVPTLRADALQKSPAKQPVVVTVAVQDVGIVPPDGSTATGTGHFAVFVDREPTKAGAPVPKERGVILTSDQTIAVPDLGGGEHILWVVLVKGDGTPFDPLIADKVVVEVG